ncbi:MAG TPA: transcriptional repressor [Candidatus Binataceae bacterium]|nr:transcriptional repressor [Candidatus Binataceae bacterium]
MTSGSDRGGYARERLGEFAARCRAGGLAVTPQRLAVIEALLASTDHPRAEDIFAQVRTRHPYISLATVHRTLETLCRVGEARKVTLLHDSARYDGNMTPHHHVVCVNCRRVRDIEVSGLERMLDGIGLDGFEPLGWSLEVQAMCHNCRRDQRSAPGNNPGAEAARSRDGRGKSDENN